MMYKGVKWEITIGWYWKVLLDFYELTYLLNLFEQKQKTETEILHLSPILTTELSLWQLSNLSPLMELQEMAEKLQNISSAWTLYQELFSNCYLQGQ